jgi:hypothetical protein
MLLTEFEVLRLYLSSRDLYSFGDQRSCLPLSATTDTPGAHNRSRSPRRRVHCGSIRCNSRLPFRPYNYNCHVRIYEFFLLPWCLPPDEFRSGLISTSAQPLMPTLRHTLACSAWFPKPCAVTIRALTCIYRWQCFSR